LVPLITPVAWVIGLWVSVVVAERAGWPNLVTAPPSACWSLGW
jgi:hypothetical protein